MKRGEVAAFMDELRRLNPNCGRLPKVQGMSWDEIVRDQDGNDKGLSPQTMNRHVDTLSSLHLQVFMEYQQLLTNIRDIRRLLIESIMEDRFSTPIDRIPDRRGRDRRVLQIPFSGPDMRKGDRREGERRKQQRRASD